MTDNVYYASASARFHENVQLALKHADGIIPVDDIRRIADRTSSEFVDELRKGTDALAILTAHPSYLDRRLSRDNRTGTLADEVFDLVEADLERSLDVRVEWASQFGQEFSPEHALEAAAAAAISVFEEAARRMAPSDVEGLETIVGPARSALARFGNDKSAESLKALDKAATAVVQGLHALGRNLTADRWHAAREAATRLGRDADGKWFMSH